MVVGFGFEDHRFAFTDANHAGAFTRAW